MTDNRANEPTAEQIVSEALGPYGLIGRARDLAARNAVERLRANGLLFEGADPSRQEIPLVCLGFESGSTFAVTGENAGHWVEGSPTHIPIAESAPSEQQVERALDGAPEPEWEERLAACTEHGTHCWSCARHKERRRPAGPWLPVEGENDEA